jgi:threonine dehydratase
MMASKVAAAAPPRKHLFTSLCYEVEQAAARIGPYVRRTPLDYSFSLTTIANGGVGSSNNNRIWLKLESEQVTGSFKARGAVNKVISLTVAERVAGIITASTGTHALAITHALAAVPGASTIPAKIFLPRSVKPAKLDALRARKAPLEIIDASDCVASEAAALQAAAQSGAVYVSPYNDAQIIGGQGTLGLEIVEQLPADSASRKLVVVVPVGGGGLITGTAVAVKSRRPDCIVIGVQPDVNDCMIESIKKGGVAAPGSFDDHDTWSDGTAGGIEDQAITFDACAKAALDLPTLQAQDRDADRVVDAVLPVDEKHIAAGMFHVLDKHHKVSTILQQHCPGGITEWLCRLLKGVLARVLGSLCNMLRPFATRILWSCTSPHLTCKTHCCFPDNTFIAGAVAQTFLLKHWADFCMNPV